MALVKVELFEHFSPDKTARPIGLCVKFENREV